VNAYQAGQKVAFHCGGGKGRTGTVAAGTLLALGISKDVDEAEATAKRSALLSTSNPFRKKLSKSCINDYLLLKCSNRILFKMTNKAAPVSLNTAIHSVSQPGKIRNNAIAFIITANQMFCLIISNALRLNFTV
jgi:hypothetical protein